MCLPRASVACRLGINEWTLSNWEHNLHGPSLRFLPRIIAFLGYDPLTSEPNTLGEKIREYRRVHGLSRKRLAQFLDLDPSTLARWEREEGEPGEELQEGLASSLRKLA